MQTERKIAIKWSQNYHNMRERPIENVKRCRRRKAKDLQGWGYMPTRHVKRQVSE